MDRSDMLSKMKSLIGPNVIGVDDDALLSTYLDIAAEKVLNRRYPFRRPADAAVEPQYQPAQLEIAVFLFNKRGIEGESLHSENGVSRSFGMSTDVPPEILWQITPKGRVG
jgi:hypothetical protein